MRLFWEFFTFELKFRAKSISTYVYFLLWFAVQLFLRGIGEFWPRRIQQRQSAAERPVRDAK